MVDEIRRFMDEQKVLFGIKESLRNSKKLEKAVVCADSRTDVKRILEANKISVEVSDLSKQEVASRLGLNFKCEVFGLRK